MRMTLRHAGAACGAIFASAALTLSATTPAWGASTALVIGGVNAGSLPDLVMSQLLGGALKDESRVNVTWPAQAGPMTGANDMTLGASIGIGVTNLTAGINTALADLDRDADGNVMNGEKVTVVGLSAGSLVVDEVLRQMMADGTAPNPNEITFVLAEDSSRQQLIKDSTYNSRLDYTYHTPPETPYHIVVVTGEYDGFADFPDRPWNLLAVANAMVGAIVVHVPVMFTDLSTVPAQDVTVTVNSQGGTTTHYLVPTATLPLVQLFPNLAPHAAALRALIDQGYSRNDPAPATGTAKTLVAASEPVTEQIPELPTESSGTATAAAEPAALGSAAHASTSTEDRATAGDTAGTAETPATDDPATADATDDPATADATDDPATAEAPAPDDSAAADTAGEGDSVAADTGASPVATGGDTASEKADEAAATEQADTTAESTNNSGSGAAGEGAEKSTTAEDSGTAGAAPTKKSWLSRTFRSSE